MVDFQCAERYGIEEYKKIVELLRGEGGCPWDRAQTHESIKKNLIEEALETAEAIDEKDRGHLIEELGDLLMQVIFHAQIAKEEGDFTFDDICDYACKKLITRHPHVFGGEKAADGDEALSLWEKAKMDEHKQNSAYEAMAGVARTLPGTWRMEKLLKKSGGVSPTELMGEPGEDPGDMIFAAVAKAKSLGLDPEELMAASCERYIGAYGSRFGK